MCYASNALQTDPWAFVNRRQGGNISSLTGNDPELLREVKLPYAVREELIRKKTVSFSFLELGVS